MTIEVSAAMRIGERVKAAAPTRLSARTMLFIIILNNCCVRVRVAWLEKARALFLCHDPWRAWPMAGCVVNDRDVAVQHEPRTRWGRVVALSHPLVGTRVRTGCAVSPGRQSSPVRVYVFR